jgi:FkbM family methyltransferase
MLKSRAMNNLIIDLGMHIGQDTAYYLARGYQVVALEPNPSLVADVSVRHAAELETGQLIILEAALSHEIGETTFYISGKNSEWSSLDAWRVEAEGESTGIAIRTVTLDEILCQFGRPHYIKCDIEGADGIFCQQLIHSQHKPEFVSVEFIAFEWLSLLFAAGYSRFQLVNQAEVRRFAPKVSFERDGEAQEWEFGSHSSGPFGLDLPENEWRSLDEVAQLWLDFQRLKVSAPHMVLDNWFDIHARL